MRRTYGNGVTFTDGENSYHTYDDFDLILESTELTYPEPKTEEIDIPERDGVLDLTGVLTGSVKYNNRTLTLNLVDLHDRKHYTAIASMLAAKIHGKKFKIILDKDPYYYYQGRVTITGFTPEGKTDRSTIVVTCDVEPYKYSTEDYSDAWKWDPFNFYTGCILDYGAVQVGGQKTISVDAGVRKTMPVFYCSNSMEVKINDSSSIELPRGCYCGSDAVLSPGENKLSFTGTGTVSVNVKVSSF